MISSLDAVRAISRERGDAVVVSTMTPNRYWESVSENRDLDLPIFGAMGKASSVALGIALAQPDKKIIILDSDGGLLMNLGSLITRCRNRAQKPRPLRVRGRSLLHHRRPTNSWSRAVRPRSHGS